MEFHSQAKDNNEGTQCQQALLILSDGSASYEKDVFEKYNAEKQVHDHAHFCYFFTFSLMNIS